MAKATPKSRKHTGELPGKISKAKKEKPAADAGLILAKQTDIECVNKVV
jgi:hypothetical protein